MIPCRWLLGVVALAAAGCGRTDKSTTIQQPALGSEERVVVEVLNAAGEDLPRRGLARIGTRYLRERGVDVIFYGTADTIVDSTLLLVRRGEPASAERVARLLGGAEIRRRPDSTLRVDLTVLLGRRWTPGPDPRP
jgi:hypothetical protein